jgi:hypothetical protein
MKPVFPMSTQAGRLDDRFLSEKWTGPHRAGGNSRSTVVRATT